MNMYIQLASGLKKITNNITSAQIIEALGYSPASQSDLANVFSSEADEFYVVDINSNIIAKIDKEGLHTTEVDVAGFKVKGHIQNTEIHVTAEEKQKWNTKPELENITDDESDELNIVDAAGNIILKVDKNGVHTTSLYLNGRQVTNEGGGTTINPLPTVSAEDNGKILQVVNGIWNKTNLEKELPTIAAEDNGKILQVVDGNWSKANLEKELPAITTADNGKFLQVVDGVWTAVAAEITTHETYDGSVTVE